MSQLTLLSRHFGWPEANDIWTPKGAGPEMYVTLARAKLERNIRTFVGDADARVGVMMANSNANGSDAPIAIVCEFQREISDASMRAVLRYAWNFCHSPLLITLTPTSVKSWSLFEIPPIHSGLNPIASLKIGTDSRFSYEDTVTESFRWIEFTSGRFFKKFNLRFKSDSRADRTLLSNLKFIRLKLLELLSEKHINIVHDLLARLIFIQFLFDRKDSSGKSALNPSRLEKFYFEGKLSRKYETLGEILQNKSDTYSLFKILDERFNGDLFPNDRPGGHSDWKSEVRIVSPECLSLLSEFVKGDQRLDDGQLALWRMYSFDTIPLEFISSIYEEFIGEPKGAHFTPGHLVDFVLDKVLPWEGNEWNIKICDPACGSGIFLVKAFQRLIYRWQKSHDEEIDSPALRSLLENNLFGIDIEPASVRVASFSLYLTMCDQIDPRHYWTSVRFPCLRNVRLVCADFFTEHTRGFRTEQDKEKYDLIVGNAPWGKGITTKDVKEWGDKFDWPIANNQPGTLFLAKAARITKPEGRIAMIQPAGALLFNRGGPASDFRKKFFLTYQVEEVVNLSALRFDLFPKAIGPACSITFRPTAPSGAPFAYYSPKPTNTREDDCWITIDSLDMSMIYPDEAAREPFVWTVLAWGKRRDLSLIRQVWHQKNIASSEELLSCFNGFKRGKRTNKIRRTLGVPTIESGSLEESSIVCNTSDLPRNDDPYFENPRNLDAYVTPALIVKQSWTVGQNRFKAVFIKNTNGPSELVMFSKSFTGIYDKTGDPQTLVDLAIGLNSVLGVFFFFLTGARIGSYIPELLMSDIKKFPIPIRSEVTLRELGSLKVKEIDQLAKRIYRIKDADWVLVEDMVSITLADFKDTSESIGREPTNQRTLEQYCDYFFRVLQSGFGEDKKGWATVWIADLPYALVAIHLDKESSKSRVDVRREMGSVMLKRLDLLNEKFLSHDPKGGSIFYRKVVKVYDTFTTSKGLRIPTVYVVKPNQNRYWTRSVAMNDADEISGDLRMWGSTLPKKILENFLK